MTKLCLDIGDTNDVSEELYDILLQAFCKKAESMGIDPATVLFDEWTVETTVEEYTHVGT